MLPSVVATADPAFEYFVYITYDAGDAFFDNAAELASAVDWIKTTVEQPLLTRGVHCQVVLLRYENDVHKPGPAFNFAMRALCVLLRLRCISRAHMLAAHPSLCTLPPRPLHPPPCVAAATRTARST